MHISTNEAKKKAFFPWDSRLVKTKQGEYLFVSIFVIHLTSDNYIPCNVTCLCLIENKAIGIVLHE